MKRLPTNSLDLSTGIFILSFMFFSYENSEYDHENDVTWAPPGGIHGTSPPKLKKSCRKLVLFPKALCLATTFPKVTQNSIFLLNLYPKSSKFSQNFQTICVFPPNARKINDGLLNSFEKYAKIMYFKQFSKEIF